MLAVVAVASWKVLDVLGRVRGRDARQAERWVGLVFAVTIFVPIYVFHDSTSLTAVAHELSKPIVEMINNYAHSTTRK